VLAVPQRLSVLWTHHGAPLNIRFWPGMLDRVDVRGTGLVCGAADALVDREPARSTSASPPLT
jgi:hypothetical protein